MSSCGVSNLRDLTIRAFVVNLDYHSRIYAKYSHDEEIRARYKTIQYLITDKIIEHLEYLHHHGRVEDDALRKLIAFLFDRKGPSVFRVEHMLRFIFNKYTTDSYPVMFKACNGSYQLFSLLSRCVGLKTLMISSASFKEAWLTKSLTHWPQLQMAKLVGVDSSDEIVNAILKNCPVLETLWIEGEAVTNEAMFSLCGNRLKKYSAICKSIRKAGFYMVERMLGPHICKTATNPGTYTLCKNNTTCSNFGRKLTTLVLSRTSVTVVGIACILEHCRSLKAIEGPVASSTNPLNCSVADAILLLRNSIIPDQKINLQLSLNSVKFGRSASSSAIQVVAECCPNLEYITLHSWGSELMDSNESSFPPVKIKLNIDPQTSSVDEPGILDFLVTKGQQVHQLAILPTRIFYLSLRGLETILKSCANVKFLLLQCFVVWGWEEELDVPPSVKHISELGFVDLELQDPTHRYFAKILSKAESLKFLVVSEWLAEDGLMEAFKHNDFANLETIVLHRANLDNVSLLHLINPRKQLSCIKYSNCKSVEDFIKRHKAAAKEKCMQIKIEKTTSW